MIIIIVITIIITITIIIIIMIISLLLHNICYTTYLQKINISMRAYKYVVYFIILTAAQ